MAEFRLETERLILRDWRPEDTATFIRHTNTPAVMRWLGGLMTEEQKAALPGRIAASAVQYGHCFWLVERRPDGGQLAGEVLGFCGLKRADAPGSPIEGMIEVGWRLREDAWGRGYAKEAAQASLAAGFEKFGADCIVAITVRENEASWGLMKRLGMRRREDLDYADPRFEPPLRDTIVYSLDRHEWEAGRA